MKKILRNGIFKDIILPFLDTQNVIINSKHIVDFNKGEFISVAEKKAIWVNNVAEIIFKILEDNNIRTAFIKRKDSFSLKEKKLCMFPITFVVRKHCFGTYLVSNPHVEIGSELGLKNVSMFFNVESLNLNPVYFKKYKKPKKMELRFFRDKDSDLISKAFLHHPEYPNVLHHTYPICLTLFPTSKIPLGKRVYEMEIIAKKIFDVIECFLRKHEITLADLKIEFGYSKGGELLVGDIISLDSWRVLIDSKNHGKKMIFEEKIDIAEAMSRLGRVTDLITGTKTSKQKKFFIRI